MPPAGLTRRVTWRALQTPDAVLEVGGGRSATVDQGSDQIGRPNEADWGACQGLEGGITSIGQIDHVMTEVGQHACEIEAGNPLPDVLMLAPMELFRGSKGKDSASKLGQSRRADHDFTRALAVLQLTIRETLPHPASISRTM